MSLASVHKDTVNQEITIYFNDTFSCIPELRISKTLPSQHTSGLYPFLYKAIHCSVTFYGISIHHILSFQIKKTEILIKFLWPFLQSHRKLFENLQQFKTD
jgi:hypothetical protein